MTIEVVSLIGAALLVAGILIGLGIRDIATVRAYMDDDRA